LGMPLAFCQTGDSKRAPRAAPEAAMALGATCRWHVASARRESPRAYHAPHSDYAVRGSLFLPELFHEDIPSKSMRMTADTTRYVSPRRGSDFEWKRNEILALYYEKGAHRNTIVHRSVKEPETLNRSTALCQKKLPGAIHEALDALGAVQFDDLLCPEY